ncbi:UDP-glucose/GDP-mannose dehydrogenase family protein [Candidimonas humi]|uniref:UDP-glucose 6-dehydrogenase n=1 Tax=Candidimonas humi TaxID=683355 RepID=A0ABV8NYI1_9BURK|nr:UDP-glucose/GDP-mannose dehydrogenase family protein [Candidimonas humi]MBV6304438.1 UDP-glucose/GDP-mannose dehydrogenase family protein [Candidimonas humi]
MKITVFGTGYVGLVTGACLADVGHHVMCVDVDAEKVARLCDGVVPIYEPGLEELVRRGWSSRHLQFTTDAQAGVMHGQIVFIAVGTPPDEDGSADLRHVLAVAGEIGRYMVEYRVIVNKSTVPVGTADKVKDVIEGRLKARAVDVHFDVCSNPEFLKEGAAIEDFTRGPRIVIGTDSDRVREVMRACYAPYNRNHDKLMFMGVRAAELTKYAANAMLATRISFMNELANLAELVGADIESVRQGIGSDPRIGYHFLYPGCGYGGSCFPKDVKALLGTATSCGSRLRVIEAVEQANDAQKHVIAEKIKARFGNDLNGRHFAIWGLSFKPNTDDLREAPSRYVIADILEAGATLSVYDPAAMSEARKLYAGDPRVNFAGCASDALSCGGAADALIILTEWKEFRSLDIEDAKSRLKQPVIFDGRNLYALRMMAEAQIEYHSVGRRSV